MLKKNKVSGDDEDYTFHEAQSDTAGFIALSHLNNKSSVLCPESQDITSQYLALQQLDAHQRMISRAKGCVDTSAPKSLQSYRSIADKKKRKLWKQLHGESQASGMNEIGFEMNSPSSCRTQAAELEETFESYEDDDEEEDETDYKNQMLKVADNSSIEEETLMSRNASNINNGGFNVALNPSLHSSEKYYCSAKQSEVLNKSEEDKYLDFLSKVTEDILRSGIYSDSAIQRAFDFHMQFYQGETNKEKLEMLCHQVLEGLKISNDEADEISNRSASLFSNSRPDTPPEKESSDVSLMNNSLRPDVDLNVMSINERHSNFYSKIQAPTDISSINSLMNNSKDS